MSDKTPEPGEADFSPEPDEATAELVAYLDGELEAGDAAVIEARIGRDPTARADADALKRTWELLDYLPRPEPSQSFTARTLERIEPLKQSGAAPAAPVAAGTAVAAEPRPPRRRRLLTGLGWAAAFLVAGAVGWLLQPAVRSQLFPAEEKGIDVADLRILENLKLYRHVDDLEFLKDLDTPELFGEDAGGSE